MIRSEINTHGLSLPGLGGGANVARAPSRMSLFNACARVRKPRGNSFILLGPSFVRTALTKTAMTSPSLLCLSAVTICQHCLRCVVARLARPFSRPCVSHVLFCVPRAFLCPTCFSVSHVFFCVPRAFLCVPRVFLCPTCFSVSHVLFCVPRAFLCPTCFSARPTCFSIQSAERS